MINEESPIGWRLHADHASILRHWNGIDVEVIRLFGCGVEARELGRLSDRQHKDLAIPGAPIIGTDAAGFIFVQADNGEILSLDTDGGEVATLATDLDDLFSRVIFGADAGMHYGDDWLLRLGAAGLLE